MLNRAYLLIGGNIGKREETLENATSLIERQIGNILSFSSVYESEAWGIREQPSFLNQVLLVETELQPVMLLKTILNIEIKMGRIRQEKYGPRTIDIDILFYNHEILDELDLKIPHPQFHLRRFAVQPMSEIASDYIHPVFNKTIAQLLIECPDPLAVKKL